jgi:hypothetical protein
VDSPGFITSRVIEKVVKDMDTCLQGAEEFELKGQSKCSLSMLNILEECQAQARRQMRQ